MKLERWLIIACVGGCSGAGLPLAADGAAPFSPEKIVSGVYRVTAEANADDCAPLLPTGALGLEAVFAEPGKLSVAVPPGRFDLAANERYGHRYTLEPSCNVPGSGVRATQTIDLQILAADDHEVQLSDIEDVQAPEGCALFSTCHSDRLLTYTLVQACPDPIAANGTSQCP